ncbi:MAG: hypothetical protein KME26_20440 [Oscillatoria princeps RMCB-10]|nr:hypothetical protein [Oscillatoria princeps RMCB-10]
MLGQQYSNGQPRRHWTFYRQGVLPVFRDIGTGKMSVLRAVSVGQASCPPSMSDVLTHLANPLPKAKTAGSRGSESLPPTPAPPRNVFILSD